MYTYHNHSILCNHFFSTYAPGPSCIKQPSLANKMNSMSATVIKLNSAHSVWGSKSKMLVDQLDTDRIIWLENAVDKVLRADLSLRSLKRGNSEMLQEQMKSMLLVQDITATYHSSNQVKQLQYKVACETKNH